MPFVRVVFEIARPGLLVLGSLLAAAPTALAQQEAVPAIAGVVTDSASGARVSGVEVSLGGQRVLTNATGEFSLHRTRTSHDTLRFRRLGFRSRVVPLQSDAATNTLHIDLTVIPQQMSPVVVAAKWDGYTGRLAGYYQRLERRTTGQFITRADLDAEQTGLLTNVLQRMPGIHVKRGNGAPELMMRGRHCQPLVWIDGVAMPSGAVDLDSFSPSSLHGVELYLGMLAAPLRFQSTSARSDCGTVVLWSRGPDTDPVGRRTSEPARLEELIAARRVFTADEVDQVATARAGEIAVEYPQLLKATKVTGVVTVEFIVDERGHVEPESFGIVTASDPRLGETILDALVKASYTPAVRNGQRVRQLVRQRFTFG